MIYKLDKNAGSYRKRNKKLDNELHRPITKEIQRRKLYSSERDNIWGPDNADVQLVSKNNSEVRFLPCVIDIYSKHI